MRNNNALRMHLLFAALLAGCSLINPAPGSITRTGDATALPVSTARWISVISLPNLYDYPAVYRGEFRTSAQCEQAFRAAVKMMSNHQSNGTVSPCVLGIATAVVPE